MPGLLPRHNSITLIVLTEQLRVLVYPGAVAAIRGTAVTKPLKLMIPKAGTWLDRFPVGCRDIVIVPCNMISMI